MQNKDAQAVHLKLDELVAALEGASSRLINVEDLTAEESADASSHHQGLVTLAQRESNLTHSHSIQETEFGTDARHGEGSQRRR